MQAAPGLRYRWWCGAATQRHATLLCFCPPPGHIDLGPHIQGMCLSGYMLPLVVHFAGH